MEMKDTLSSCSDLDEQEIQQLQNQAKILKENSLNKLNALKIRIQHLSSSNSSMYYEFREAFHQLFNADKFSKANSNKKHSEKDSNSGLSTHFTLEAQTFKETIIHNLDFIEQCIFERARHEQELQNRLKRLNEKKLQIQECKIQEVKASNACSGDTYSSGIVSDKGDDQSVENHSNTSRDESSRSRNECNDKSTSRDDTDIKPSYDTEPIVDSNVIPDSPDICDNEIQTDHNAKLKKANVSLTQELKECKSTLAKTSRTLGESNSIQDSCLVALQNKHTELEKYMAFNDRTVDYDKLEQLVDQAWEKHSHDHFRAPTAHDMEILIKTCLMPLALKTQNASFAFVHELKQEMHVDLKYVESLEKEIDQFESDKAEFSNMYDILLQECVSNDVMCSYLHSLSDLDTHFELQCLYLHKVKEYLKAQLQDKDIAISELKKHIEKSKGKGVDTNFEKQSILGKPPLQPIRNQLVLSLLKQKLVRVKDMHEIS
ncbi:hypothetical protein Tco_1050444 [Tanacetum coccineum]